MKIGDKVNWYQGKRKRVGTIHGVRKSENENGVEKIIGYVIDTGKELYSEPQVDKKGEALDPFIQPETIILDADQVTPAE